MLHSSVAKSVLPVGLVLALSGCKGCGAAGDMPIDLGALNATVTGVTVGEGIGVGSAIVPLFATNAVGAPVPATDLAASAGVFAVDPSGWGTTVLDATSGVSASSGGFSASGNGWVTSATPPSFENPGFALHSIADVPGHLAVAGGGATWLAGSTVWWASAGQPAIAVTTLPDDGLGLQPVQLDNDGITDLAVWSGTTVVLLRGRDGGGLTFAAGWTAVDGQSVLGCDVQDLDGDGTVDIQVATSDGAGTDVSWLIGDGTAWTLSEVLTTDFVSLGVAGEDYTGDGEVEVSLITEDGLLRRYIRVKGGWEMGQASDHDVGVGPGSRVYPSTDLDDDGLPEIIVAGPMLDGRGTEAMAITAGASSQLTYYFYTDDDTRDLPTYAELAIGDLSGDTIADVALASNLGFLRIAWNADHVTDDGSGSGTASPAFESATASDYPTAHGIGVGQLSEDGIQDVLLAGDNFLVALLGAAAEDDPDTLTDETGDWKAPASHFSVFNLRIAGEPVVEDFDGDGGLDFLSFTESDLGLELQTWHSFPATDTTSAGWTDAGGGVISTAGPIALTVCGATAWALTDDGMLSGISLNSAGVAGATATTANVSGDQILCGPFADGSAVAVADHSGATLTGVTSAGVLSQAALPGATVASADTDGDGVLEVVSLPDAGQIIAYDFDGDGIDEVIQDSGDEVWVGSGAARASFGGTMSVFDTDADGVAEVVFQDGGTVWLYPFLAGALAPPVVFHTTRPVQGAAHLGDVSGDGVPDLLLLGDETDVSFAGAWLVELG